jgi:DNA-binding MarR family transcriptional regulator
MNQDLIDVMNAAWQEQLPGLDPSPIEVVGRIIVLAQHLEQAANAALSKHDLTLGQFDILATLRRQGPQGRLTPKELMKSVMLSSGGMTSRLDRLEQAGWIRREADPHDRRGVMVALTEAGRIQIEAATATRFQQAEEAIPPMLPEDRQVLVKVLRCWLSQIATQKQDQ